MLKKISIIKQLPNGRYRLYSRKKDKAGKRRNLGTFDSHDAAKKREKAIQFFKYHADDQNSRDKETKALSILSDIASYLEEAGYSKQASDIYNVMDAIDNSLDNEDSAADFIPDLQRNTDNENTLSDTSISSGLLSMPEATKAARILYNLANELDKFGFFKDADIIDSILYKMATNSDKNILEKVILIKRDFNDGNLHFNNSSEAMKYLAKKLNMNINNRQQGGFITGLAVAMDFIGPNDAFGDPEHYRAAIDIFNNYTTFKDIDEMDNVDMLARLNGLQGITSIDGGSAGQFSGFSDAYFFQNYQNLDHRYKLTP